jgi:hypothetical protein
VYTFRQGRGVSLPGTPLVLCMVEINKSITGYLYCYFYFLIGGEATTQIGMTKVKLQEVEMTITARYGESQRFEIVTG